ncbi:MAG: cell division protein PerM [Streptosporangiaceae bacterium]
MSVSAEAPLAPDPDGPDGPDGPGLPGSSGPGGPGDGRRPRTQPARPLVVTGGIAACAAAASGLAVLTTLTAIGWITAPHVGVGSGLGGVLRTAAMLWLVAHHVGFTVRGAGRIGLLPLGLVLLPGALLAVAGRWVVRAGAVTRLRHVGYAAIALALPYALLAGALAVASRTAVAAPSLLQAVVASFLLALVAGGLGAARTLAPWSRLASLMPARPRSIVMGMLGSAAILAAAGAVLAGASLAVHLPEVRVASDALAPGVGGAALLLLAQLAYAPNAIIWAVAYSLGPGFAFGAGTVVAPTGSALGAVPLFPMLAAMPSGSRPGGPAWVPVAVLAVPYLAGIFAGIITVRIAPTPVIEAAPLWGFAAGAAAGGLAGLGAAFAGGPLGDGRLSAVGPSGFQVGLVAILQIGVTAALAAAATNWLILRRASRPGRAQGGSGGMDPPRIEGFRGVAPPSQHRQHSLHLPPGQHDETDDAGGHRIYLNPWAAGDQDDQDDW